MADRNDVVLTHQATDVVFTVKDIAMMTVLVAELDPEKCNDAGKAMIYRCRAIAEGAKGGSGVAFAIQHG